MSQRKLKRPQAPGANRSAGGALSNDNKHSRSGSSGSAAAAKRKALTIAVVNDRAVKVTKKNDKRDEKKIVLETLVGQDGKRVIKKLDEKNKDKGAELQQQLAGAMKRNKRNILAVHDKAASSSTEQKTSSTAAATSPAVSTAANGSSAAAGQKKSSVISLKRPATEAGTAKPTAAKTTAAAAGFIRGRGAATAANTRELLQHINMDAKQGSLSNLLRPPPKVKAADPSHTTVILRNVHPGLNATHILTQVVGPDLDVVDCTINVDEKGLSLGFAEVIFYRLADAKRFIAEKNGMILVNKPLRMSIISQAVQKKIELPDIPVEPDPEPEEAEEAAEEEEEEAAQAEEEYDENAEVEAETEEEEEDEAVQFVINIGDK